jgi:hypothetical protein
LLYGKRCVVAPPIIETFNAGARDFLSFDINIQVINLGTQSQTISAEVPFQSLRLGWVRTDGKYYNDSTTPALGAKQTSTVPANSNGGFGFSVNCRITWSSVVSCSSSWSSAAAIASIGNAKLTNSAIYGGATAKVCVQEDIGAVMGSVYARYSSDNVAVGTDKSFSIQLNGGRPF